MKINEIFLSVQGEGTRSGELCIFIRLAGCSFGCFYCDTKYANTEDAKEYSTDELVEIAKSYGINLVEITGGEPLEQKETPLLAEKLLAAGFVVLIETNGAHDISVLPDKIVKIMDIKLPWVKEKSEEKRVKRGENSPFVKGWMPQADGVWHFYYKNLQHLSASDEVKFVINNDADYDWAKNFIRTHKIPCKVIFSPCAGGVSATNLAEKIIADKLPVRLGLQIHKYLWGDKRGV